MTLDFYNLKEEPFGFLPDSRFLYLSATHRQALASLLLELQAGRSFVTLLAPRGLGKTTLLFHTLNSFGDKVVAVYLFQAPRTRVDLLRAILTSLDAREVYENAEGMLFQLREVLLDTHRLGKRIVIVIDEAQNLDTSIFDMLCALSNLATLGAKLIQVVLCGQPVLSEKLAAIQPMQGMEGSAAAHLEPFSAQDTAQYVDHRLRTAGYNRQSPLFTPEAAALVAGYSQGTPRIINHLCFEALSTAYRYRREQIGADTVHEAAANLDLARPKQEAIAGRLLPAPAALQVPVKETAAPGPLASPPAGAEKAVPAVLTEEFLPALQPSQAAASQARRIKIAVRSLVSRPLPGSLPRLLSGATIAAVLLLIVTGAVFGTYRAQTVQPAAKQTMAVSPLPHPFGPIAQRERDTPVLSTETAPAVNRQNMNAALEPSTPIHDLKGMDLQSALRALSTRKQRQQQGLLRGAR